jgi:hypothetical protein
MRNASLVLALLIGYLVALVAKVDGKSFVTMDIINQSPIVTFLWVKTFPLSEFESAREEGVGGGEGKRRGGGGGGEEEGGRGVRWGRGGK